jgi:hypothetical protein
MCVPPLLLQQEQFQGWMLAFHTALRKQLPWVSRGAVDTGPGGAGCVMCV